jgi:hypothetical protein
MLAFIGSLLFKHRLNMMNIIMFTNRYIKIGAGV